ncbi:MAG: ATP-binding protein, partial [Planctomycetes bacterium]|nr:ATP-binding protein [Planctomycetota bacterium]
MQELVVISGKGGTGKTSIVASFAVLAQDAILADCDVDAADLHLVLKPTIVQREEFSGGSQARILPERCTVCGKCTELCRFEAISRDGPGNGKADKTYRVDAIACEGCGVCAHFCPENAIEFGPVVNGELFISGTRCGPMVHARLGVAAENSGKLVSLVRTRARQLAEQRRGEFILIDGPPGIGCPVIASLTGASLALVVTEPTLSGEHDLERVLGLTRHFNMPAAVCVNKWDLNPSMAERIERKANAAGAAIAGRVRYDMEVTTAQIQAQATVEREGGAADDIRRLWNDLKDIGDR